MVGRKLGLADLGILGEVFYLVNNKGSHEDGLVSW